LSRASACFLHAIEIDAPIWLHAYAARVADPLPKSIGEARRPQQRAAAAAKKAELDAKLRKIIPNLKIVNRESAAA
jgi:hypothetical protein